MKNVKIKKILRNLLLGIVICFSCLSTPNIEAASATRYMGVVLYNEENFELNYRIYKKDYNSMYKISKNICGYNGMTGTERGCKLGADDSLIPDNFNLSGTQGRSDETLGKFIFPSVTTTDSKTQATSQDFKQADIVLGTLVNNFNSGLSFIKKNSTNNIATLSKISQDFAKTVTNPNALDNYGIGVIDYFSAQSNERFANAVKAIEKKVNSSEENNSPYKGLSKSDYVILYSKQDKTVSPLPLICRMPTGYGNGQIFSSKASDPLASSVSWLNLVSMAETAKINGLTADSGSFDNLTEMGSISKYLNEFIEGLIDTIGVDVLGFYSLESMILNRDARGQSYYLGMMPYDWFQKANTIFWVAEIIAVFVLIASILYTVYQENYAIVSPSTRINLQDRVQNLLIAILLLIMYVPLFYILAKFNQSIVELLDSLVNGATLSYSLNLNFILRLIMAIVNLGIMIKLNFDYLVRALTITILHVMSPVAIASISISEGKNRRYFNAWLKELVSAIFMQTFDAAILILFLLILKSGPGNGRWWEIAFMSFMFVPLNSWFKQNFGGGNNIGRTAELVQGNAKTAWKNTAGAVGTAASFIGNLGGNVKMANDRRISSNTGSSQTSSSTGETQSETPNANGKTSYSGAKNDGDGVSKGKVITEASGTESSKTSSSKSNPNYKPRKNAFIEGLAITTMQSAGMRNLAEAEAKRSEKYWNEGKEAWKQKNTNTSSPIFDETKPKEREESKRINIGSYEMEEDNKYIEPYNNDLEKYQKQIDLEQQEIKQKALSNDEQEFDAGEEAEFNENALDYSQIINDESCNTYAQAKRIKPEKARQELTTIINDKNIPITERKQNLAQTLANAKTENTINKDVERKVYNDIGGKNIYEVGQNAIDIAQKISNNNKEIYGNVFEKPFNKIKNDKSLTDNQKHEKYAEVLAPYMKEDYLKENNIQRKNNDNFTPQPKS